MFGVIGRHSRMKSFARADFFSKDNKGQKLSHKKISARATPFIRLCTTSSEQGSNVNLQKKHFAVYVYPQVPPETKELT